MEGTEAKGPPRRAVRRPWRATPRSRAFSMPELGGHGGVRSDRGRRSDVRHHRRFRRREVGPLGGGRRRSDQTGHGRPVGIRIRRRAPPAVRCTLPAGPSRGGSRRGAAARSPSRPPGRPWSVGRGRPTGPLHIALAVLELIADVSTQTPLLIVVDDLHWVDPPRRNVIDFVSRRLEAEPTVMLQSSTNISSRRKGVLLGRRWTRRPSDPADGQGRTAAQLSVPAWLTKQGQAGR
jgi:hypothetical protein